MNIILKLLYVSTTLLYASSNALAAEPRLTKVDLFTAGDQEVALYRIPGMVVTSQGSVLAYCEARRNTRADWGEIEIHLRRSTDGGQTWDEQRRIAHNGPRIEGNPTKVKGGETEQTVNNPVAIVDRVTGNIEFLYCVNYARCFSMRSVDDGLSWSEPIEITATFAAFQSSYPWSVIATGPGHGVQLKSGRLVVPIWLAYGKNGAHHPSAAATIFSDDHGKSWQAGEIAVPNSEPFVDPNETMITTLSDDRVLLVTRSESKASRKILTSSADGATHWSKPMFHDQLVEPICMASIVRHPAHSGMLLFSNPHSQKLDTQGKEIPGGRGKRENLMVKLSQDDGQSWPIQKTLEPGASAYSDLAVLPDGDVLCFYEADKRLVCARFNLEWLKQP